MDVQLVQYSVPPTMMEEYVKSVCMDLHYVMEYVFLVLILLVE